MDSKVGLLVTPMQLPQLFQATGVQLLGWIGLAVMSAFFE